MRRDDKQFDPFAETPVDGVIAAQCSVQVSKRIRSIFIVYMCIEKKSKTLDILDISSQCHYSRDYDALYFYFLSLPRTDHRDIIFRAS